MFDSDFSSIDLTTSMALPAGTVVSASPTSHIYQGKWWSHRGILTLNFMLLFLLFSASASGFDGSLMNGLQATPQWASYFGQPRGATLGLYNAIQSTGSLVASPLTPFIADRFGRRIGIIFGCLCMLLATGIQAGARNNGMFIAARGLIGFGSAFAYISSALLIAELAYPSQRATLTSLFNTMWLIGAIVAAATISGTFRIHSTASWRIPSAMMGVLPALQMLFIWFIPESPRWLTAQGRQDAALAVLAKYHATECGNVDDELVKHEHNEIKSALCAEMEASSSTSYLSLLATPGNRRRLRINIGIACFSQLSGNGLTSYYLNSILKQIGVGVSDKAQVQYFNLGLSFYNFLLAVIAAFVVERFGRRKLFLTSNAGMLLAYVLWTVGAGLNANNPHNYTSAHLVMAMLFVFSGFYAIAYTPLAVLYPLEITPYRIRAKMVAVLHVFTGASLVFNQYVNPVALDKIEWKYYIVYVGWLTFELVFAWLYAVETKGRSLEATAALFDGEGVAMEVKEPAAEIVDHSPVADKKSDEDQKEMCRP